VMEEPLDALLAAIEEMEGADGVVLVTGSFHTAAGVLGWLRGGGR
jgi:folylpolyglutamate synthase/dihydropteroate synthase